MEENQKNKENKQEVSEMKNKPQEDEIEDPEGYLASFPPGYRFNPTDEELINHYLKPKNLGQRLRANKIKEVNLNHYSPQQLYETYKLEGEKMVYCFTPRERKYPRGTRPSRSAANGFWKPTGVDAPVGNPKNPIGYRRPLVFYEGNSRESTKTNWIMHEYTTQKSTPSTSRAPQNKTMDGCVLCRVYRKSAKGETNPGQSDLQSPLPAGSLPPRLDHVNSQSPAHTEESSFPEPQVYQDPLVHVRHHPPACAGESSFPVPQVDQNRLVSVKPQPPGLHNINHPISAHTGGYRVPMPRSNQDLLSTRPPPSEMSNIHSSMPGNSGQTRLRKPDQLGFRNTRESYCNIENRPLLNIVPHVELPNSVLKPQSNQDLSLLNGYNTNDFTMSNCNGQINGYYCGDHKYSQDLSTGLVHDLATESLLMDDEMLESENLEMTEKQDFPGVPVHMTGLEVPLPDFDFSFGGSEEDDVFVNSLFYYPELPDFVTGDREASSFYNIGYNGNILFPELQSNKDFMPPTRPGTHYTDSQAYMQRNCYPESLPLPNSEHDSNEVPSEHHNNLPEEDDAVSSELARDKPSQHGLQEKDDKQLGS